MMASFRRSDSSRPAGQVCQSQRVQVHHRHPVLPMVLHVSCLAQLAPWNLQPESLRANFSAAAPT